MAAGVATQVTHRGGDAMKPLTVEQITMLAYKLQLDFIRLTRQPIVPAWGRATDEDKEKIRVQVRHYLRNPAHHAIDFYGVQYEEWVKDGWRYGPKLDIDNKLSPQVVPFEALNEATRRSFELVKMVVATVRTDS